MPLLLVAVTHGWSVGHSAPHSGASRPLLTVDGIEHVLLGDAYASRKTVDRDSNLELRREMDDASENPPATDSVRTKEVVFDSVRDIPPRDDAGRPNYVPGQIIVRFHNGISHHRQDQIIEELGARLLRTLDVHRGEYLVALPGGLSVPAAAEQFAKLQEVDFAEPNILHYINDVPNDRLYALFDNQPTELQRWYFDGIGSDHNLNAEAAWGVTKGSRDIVIAVIDTGVALQHPDLASNIWTNPGEIPGNGIDDDGDGLVDDVYGWDFYNDDNDPNPDLGDGISGDRDVFHGTFVAGCAAAVSDNGEGVAGASWYSRIMPLKVFTNTGGAPSSAIADAIYYAIDHGANVINMSFGSSIPSKAIYRAVQEASADGIILVSAAGNGNTKARSYPASFRGVIAVGGSGSGSATSGSPAEMRERASFSQFGPRAVDVVAPAVDIVSTAVLSLSDEMAGYGKAGDFEYFYGNGTSFASPLVAGEAALLLSRVHELGLDGCITAEAIERVILTATTDLGDDPADSPDGGPHWAGHGRVDFFAAVQQIGPELVTGPRAPGRFRASVTDSGDVELSWVDNSNNEQGFRIERAVRDGSSVSSFEVVADVTRNVTSYTDSTAQSGVTYLYRIAAINPAATNYVRRAAMVSVP
ncbi:MAG TPA: S8 family serine peptidase [Verrucomicrobiae bacterium]|nr:S8 family serine peptidase [Verrucomicrobiae bacterium]